MPSKCTHEEHDLIRSEVHYFMAETEGHQKWAGVLSGQCRLCSSTLALELCLVCSEPCPTSDALPWGNPADERVGHFSCIAQTLLAGRRHGRFVILVGGGQAREFVRKEAP